MSLIDKIKETVLIVDLVDLLHLERGNINSKGFFVKSIYTNDRTPSMQIYEKENKYYCYATGTSGDIIQLWQDFYSVDISTALKDLSHLYGLQNDQTDINYGQTKKIALKKFKELKPENLSDILSNNEVQLFNEQWQKFFGPKEENIEYEFTEAFKTEFQNTYKKILIPVKQHRLEMNKIIFKELYSYCNNMPGDKPFFEYLVEKRKFDFRKVMAFKCFFIINYNKINNHMKKQEMFSLADLQRSGLYNRKEDGNGNLIFYNHRLIIPYLHDNEIIYLRGRFFDKENNTVTPPKQNKYFGLIDDMLGVNTPKRFFNLDVLKKMLPGEKLLMVEGEADTIAGETIGKNTIGIPGAGNIPPVDKFKILLPFDITICGDNDTAGNKMITGDWKDSKGNEKHSDHNLIQIFKSLNKKITIKRLPSKDLNDLIAA